MRNKALVFVGISGFIGVMLGALGAHALSGKVEVGLLSPKSMHAYETAVHYQMLHTLAIVAMLGLKDKYLPRIKIVIILFMLGIILFSGSIYLLVAGELTEVNLKVFGPVTPVGGLCFMAGWLMLVVSAIKNKSELK